MDQFFLIKIMSRIETVLTLITTFSQVVFLLKDIGNMVTLEKF